MQRGRWNFRCFYISQSCISVISDLLEEVICRQGEGEPDFCEYLCREGDGRQVGSSEEEGREREREAKGVGRAETDRQREKGRDETDREGEKGRAEGGERLLQRQGKRSYG
jgi:hypothetical protein